MGKVDVCQGLFAPHSNSVKSQLKWGVPEIRRVGVFEKSVVSRGFSLCVFCTAPYLYAHVSSCNFFSATLRAIFEFQNGGMFS